MRISSDRTISGVVESLYRQNAPQPENTELTVSQLKVEDSVSINGQQAVISDAKVQPLLTGHELEALDVLFGDGTGEHRFFYGGHRMSNMQQGFLLDIKG